MPRIQGYEQQYSALGGRIPARQAESTDFGGTGLLEVGRAIQSAGQDAGFAMRQIQMAESQRQVTDVHSALQMLRAEFTKKAIAAESSADPSDTTIGDFVLFGESGEGDAGSLKWALDTYREHISDPVAKQAFDRGAADLTTHFTIHFANVQARMAGTYAQQQMIQMIDAGQNTVQLDPDQHRQVSESVEQAINDPNGIFYRPGLDAGVRERFKRMAKEQLAESAVRGRIRQDPVRAKQVLEAGFWDDELTGEKRAILLSSADTAIKAREVAANQALAEERRQQAELRHQTDRNLMAKYLLHQENPGNPEFPAVTATEVAQEMAAGRLDGGVGRAIINMMEADSKEKTLKSDNSTYWKLFGRITLPWGHPDKLTSMQDVYDAAAQRKLTSKNVEQLAADFEKARNEDGLRLVEDRRIFLDSMKSSITHSNLLLGKLDQEGDVNFGRFSKMVRDEEAKAIKENRDPHELYDESSKYYLGKRLGKYRKTMEQSMETISRGLKPSSPTQKSPTKPSQSKARLPGETIQQYKERMKK